MEKAQIIWPKTIKVIIGKYRKPRPNERTWPMIRCSIAYNGRTKTLCVRNTSSVGLLLPTTI
jgi:hypothetical protein